MKKKKRKKESPKKISLASACDCDRTLLLLTTQQQWSSKGDVDNKKKKIEPGKTTNQQSVTKQESGKPCLCGWCVCLCVCEGVLFSSIFSCKPQATWASRPLFSYFERGHSISQLSIFFLKFHKYPQTHTHTQTWKMKEANAFFFVRRRGKVSLSLPPDTHRMPSKIWFPNKQKRSLPHRGRPDTYAFFHFYSDPR